MSGVEKFNNATISVFQTVPVKNGVANDYLRDVVGNKTDDGDGDSLFSLAHVLHEHAHSKQKVYPTLADGVTVTGAVGAWTLGAFAVVVPANTITSPFDIHHINVAAYNANDTFELVLYSGANGAEVEVGRTRFTRTSNVGAVSQTPMMTDIIPANSQIKAKLASQAGTSNTATISILYHTY